jgi:hypothetical protein
VVSRHWATGSGPVPSFPQNKQMAQALRLGKQPTPGSTPIDATKAVYTLKRISPSGRLEREFFQMVERIL